MFKKNNKILSIFLLIVTVFLSCGKSENEAPPEPPIEENPTIVWDASSRKLLSDAGSTVYNGYARIIQLKDKSLLLVYESNGAILLKTSTDAATTWSVAKTVVAKPTNANMTTPDILQLDNGKILVFYNPRPTVTSERFAIRVIESNNNGATWSNDQLLYEAGNSFNDGCWEPSAIQLPNGEIQLFFSNEGIYTTSSEQNISLLRSTDNGVSWTSTPEIASFNAGSRDGMPKPIYLPQTQTIVFSIEDNGGHEFKPYTIRNTLTENWQTIVSGSSSNRNSALLNQLPSNIYAGAPYLAKLSSGKTLMSYQSTENKTSHGVGDAEMIVAIGDKNAQNFTHKTVPFSIPSTKNALWNSIVVLDDDTIIALTSTNSFSTAGATEVWMVKGVYKEADE